MLSCALHAYSNSFSHTRNYLSYSKRGHFPLWLLKEHYLTIWVEGMFNHMCVFKQNHSSGIPYGSLIAKILDRVGVDLAEENMDLVHYQINSLSLIKIRVHMVCVELRSDYMEEE